MIPPSIDPLSTKNQDLQPSAVRDTLQLVGLLDGGTGQPWRGLHPPGRLAGPGPPAGGPARNRAPAVADVPVVLQASRWDGLKDMAGVMAGFADHLAAMGAAHLVLAGPAWTALLTTPRPEVLAHCLGAVAGAAG